jgi:hypothetical protein
MTFLGAAVPSRIEFYRGDGYLYLGCDTATEPLKLRLKSRAAWHERHFTTHARSEYVRTYAEGFKRLGYATVLDRQIKKSNGQPMYFLIFATDNDAGEKIMNWVFDRVRLRVQEELGQTTLFDMESGPRKRRLNGGDS